MYDLNSYSEVYSRSGTRDSNDDDEEAFSLDPSYATPTNSYNMNTTDTSPEQNHGQMKIMFNDLFDARMKVIENRHQAEMKELKEQMEEKHKLELTQLLSTQSRSEAKVNAELANVHEQIALIKRSSSSLMDDFSVVDSYEEGLLDDKTSNRVVDSLANSKIDLDTGEVMGILSAEDEEQWVEDHIARTEDRYDHNEENPDKNPRNFEGKRKTANDLFFKRRNEKKLGILDNDTYTLMMLSRNIFGFSWLLGFSVFAFQCLLASQALWNQSTVSFGDSFLNIPVHSQISVRIVQFASIIIAVYIQEDVVNAIRIPVILRFNGPYSWSQTIGIPSEEATFGIWLMHVLLPNFLKFTQGMIVLFASLLVIIQSDDSVELLKDFTALFIISCVDNVVFIIIKRGYFGERLEKKAIKSEDTPIFVSDENNDSSTQALRNSEKAMGKGYIIKILSVHILLVSFLLLWLLVVIGQYNGTFVRQKYPLCFLDREFNPVDVDTSKIYDNRCDGQYNTPQCGFDGGDCRVFNERYPNCTVDFPAKIGNSICNGNEYNTLKCGFDGGDCIEFNEKYPNCRNVRDPFRVGDGKCDRGRYDTSFCDWDGGDCLGLPLQRRRPDCNVTDSSKLGDGSCDAFLNNLECGFDEGDCDVYNIYPNCFVDEPSKIGDGICNGQAYNSLDCGFDGGDCLEFNENYPNCTTVEDPFRIGDGNCDQGFYDVSSCDWDGQDCLGLSFEERRPHCNITDVSKLGNGQCDGFLYNSIECGWDEGDCDEYNSDPNYEYCAASEPYKLGNGICDVTDTYEYDNIYCMVDGGDCLFVDSSIRFPMCTSNCSNILIGDGNCDEVCNSFECGWDSGDCSVPGFPECRVADPNLVGDSRCNFSGNYNTKECGFDAGDCIEYNQSKLKQRKEFFCINLAQYSYHKHEFIAQDYNGHLMSVHSDEYQFILSNILTVFQSSLSEIWISGNDEKNDTVWVHEDGTPFDYSNWHPDQPSNSEGHDCILLTKGGLYDDTALALGWQDELCSNKYAAVYTIVDIALPTVDPLMHCISSTGILGGPGTGGPGTGGPGTGGPGTGGPGTGGPGTGDQRKLNS